MQKRPLPKNPKPKPGATSSIAATIARVSGLATRALDQSALEPSDEDVARLLALEAARRPLVEGRGGFALLDASAPAAAAAAKKPNVNKHFLANTIRSVSSHNRREEEAECWRVHGAQNRVGERSRQGRSSSPQSRNRSRSRDKKRRRSWNRSRGMEGKEGGHVPLRAPPPPRIVGRDGNAAAAVADRWERGVVLSPLRGGGSGPGPVIAVNDGASVSSSASSSSSAARRRSKKAKKQIKKIKKKEKKRRKK